MEYSLKNQGNNISALKAQLLKNGENLPDFLQNEPTLDESLYFYLQAFNELETERPVNEFGVLPIPILKIIEYGRNLGYFDFQDMQVFIHIIRSLDNAVLNYWNKKNAKASKENSTISKASAKTS